MDCSDLHRLLSVIFFLFSFTYSHRLPNPLGRRSTQKVQEEKLKWKLIKDELRDKNLTDNFYKQQIIDRIGFTPVFYNKSVLDQIRRKLPTPIARRIYNLNHPTSPPSPDHEIMAIGNRVPRCLHSHASACFVFRITDDLQYLKQAVLWVDLRSDRNFIGHRISIHEVVYNGDEISIREQIGSFIVITSHVSQTESIARDITLIVRQWSYLAKRRSRNVISRAIAIICDDCDEGFSPVSEDRVILELAMYPRTKRNKRSRPNETMNTCGSIAINCCLQRYSLNFARIGWDSWVVYPQQFTPNYCMGSCDGNVFPQTQHASMLSAAVRRMNNLSPRQRNSMLPCCAPSAMGSFTLMFLDPNGKVQLHQMHNLVAFSCGCL